MQFSSFVYLFLLHSFIYFILSFFVFFFLFFLSFDAVYFFIYLFIFSFCIKNRKTKKDRKIISRKEENGGMRKGRREEDKQMKELVERCMTVEVVLAFLRGFF